MKSKDILVLGSGEVGVHGLRVLSKKNFNLFVITDPSDIGKDSWKPSLANVAKRLGIPYDNPQFPYLPKGFDPIIAFSFQYTKIIKKDFLEALGVPVINFHPAPLPELRGADGCAWAILQDLKFFGTTVHLIDAGVDTGEIISKETFPIKKDDTTWTLFKKNNYLMKKIIDRDIDKLILGNYEVKKQAGRVSFHKRGELDFSKLMVDLTASPVEIDRFIRSRIFPPLQMPYLSYSGKKEYVRQSFLANNILTIVFENNKIRKIKLFYT